MKKVIDLFGAAILPIIFLSASVAISPATYFSKNGIIRHDIEQEKYVAVMALARVSSANEWIDSVLYTKH